MLILMSLLGPEAETALVLEWYREVNGRYSGVEGLSLGRCERVTEVVRQTVPGLASALAVEVSRDI